MERTRGRRILALALAAFGAGCPAERRDPVLPPTELSGVWHRVEAGESVYHLARRYGVPACDIEELNGIERGARLAPGRKVFVPGARASDAQGAGGSTSASPAEGTGQGSAPSARPAGTGARTVLAWPVPGGTVTSRFGRRGASVHEGIDIAAAEGSAVLAAGEGTVIYAGAGVRGYGNLILIRHPGGLVTVYAHNRRNLVEEKAPVRQGQVIAEVGHTGSASADHLHFEVREGDRAVDPLRHVSP